MKIIFWMGQDLNSRTQNSNCRILNSNYRRLCDTFFEIDSVGLAFACEISIFQQKHPMTTLKVSLGLKVFVLVRQGTSTIASFLAENDFFEYSLRWKRCFNHLLINHKKACLLNMVFQEIYRHDHACYGLSRLKEYWVPG